MANPKNTSEWMGTQQVADRFAVNTSTVYAGIKTGRIPAVRLGAVYRIPTSWVEAQVASALGDTPRARGNEMASTSGPL